MVLAQQGVEIDFLTYGEGQDVDLPGVRIIRIPRFGFLGKVSVGPSYLKLFLDVFMVLWTLALLIRHRYDFVHAHEEAVFYAAMLKPIFRFKMIYDMHSSLPQQLSNFKFTKSKFLIGLFTRLEDYSLRKANAVITICPDLANYATGRIEDQEKHFLIENSIFEPVRLAGAAAASGDEQPVTLPAGRKIVVYAGTLEPYQGVDILVKSFAKIFAVQPDALLLVVGGTPEQVQRHRDIAQEAGVAEQVVFTGRVSQRLAKQYCAMAAVQTSPRSAGTNTPLKVYEQLASGIPLVATRIYSHTQVLTDDVAYLVEPNPDDMARGVLAALKDGAGGNTRAARAREVYETKYSRPVYEGKIRRLLERIKTCAASRA